MYQDTAYGQRVGNHKDYGLYWVKSQGYDTVVEFHLDSAGPKSHRRSHYNTCRLSG